MLTWKPLTHCLHCLIEVVQILLVVYKDNKQYSQHRTAVIKPLKQKKKTAQQGLTMLIHSGEAWISSSKYSPVRHAGSPQWVGKRAPSPTVSDSSMALFSQHLPQPPFNVSTFMFVSISVFSSYFETLSSNIYPSQLTNFSMQFSCFPAWFTSTKSLALVWAKCSRAIQHHGPGSWSAQLWGLEKWYWHKHDNTNICTTTCGQCCVILELK